MKKVEAKLLSADELMNAKEIGERITRLRLARNVLQADAAVRAGLSRPTARKIEQGDPGRTLGQILRYLSAIAPGMTLLQLLAGQDPSLIALAEAEKRQRARALSPSELKKLDF